MEKPGIMGDTRVVDEDELNLVYSQTYNGYVGNIRNLVVECKSFRQFCRIAETIGEYNNFDPTMVEVMEGGWGWLDGVWLGFEDSPVLYVRLHRPRVVDGLVPELFVDLVYRCLADEYHRSGDGLTARFWWD